MGLKTILAAALIASFAAPAFAQQGGGAMMTPEQREARFNQGDKNKDGKLDKAEWMAILPERAKPMADQIWSRNIDPDDDGFVTKEQFMAIQMSRPGGR